MNQSEMIQSLRVEIAKLQRALDALLDEPSTPEPARRPGRPSGSGNRATSFNPEEFAPKKRTKSAEGKARIAAAQKKRWAAQKDSSIRHATAKHAALKGTTSKAAAPKLVGKAAPATAKKSAGKRTASTPASVKTSGKRATNKTIAKKTAAKKTIRAAVKRPAKQAAGAAPELQTTA